MAKNQAKGSPKVANYRRSEKRAARYVRGLRDRISGLNRELKAHANGEQPLTAAGVSRRAQRRDKAERLLERNPNNR
jgi:hypothetical protein